MRPLAVNDPSAAVPARSPLLPAVEQAASDAHAAGERLALLWIDRDGAAPAAGEPGRPADSGLTALARVLRLAIGATGAVVREDGDRFAVVLRGADIADACETADALRAVVERHFAESRPVTVSIGVASSPASVDWTGDEIAALARARCTEAMRAGGNRVHGHGPAAPGLARLARWPAWRVPDTAAGGRQLRLGSF